MKTKSVSLGFLAATLFAGSAWAQADSPAGAPPPPPEGEHRPMRDERLKRFDANHVGKLDDAERATARAEWQKRMAERREDFHGRGHHHRHWRKMMRVRHWRRMHQRQAMLQRFDRDGDHQLSAAERGDARKAGAEMRTRFQQGRPQMLERFDANHDGRLDENERQGARDAWQEFLQQRPVLAAPAAPPGK